MVFDFRLGRGRDGPKRFPEMERGSHPRRSSGLRLQLLGDSFSGGGRSVLETLGFESEYPYGL